MPTLADAIILAVNAHRDQVDKVGQPYYLHPLRVMTRVRPPTEKIAAVLHDILEDTDYKPQNLRLMGYSEEILAALDCLTRRDNETYEQFIDRLKPNPIARRVKIADLEDNLDLTRFHRLIEANSTSEERLHTLDRLDRYVRAWHTLMDC